MQKTGLQVSPLSAQQARLWALQQKSPVYRTLCAIQIQGVVEGKRLKMAVSCIVKRHEILRTRFYTLPSMDVPVQIIRDDPLWSYTEISLEQLDPVNQGVKRDDFFTALQRERVDLRQIPPLHVWLCRFAADRHLLLVSLPALCADSSSLQLFLHELTRAYARETLTEVVLQYADIAAWQEKVLEKEKSRSHYWHNEKSVQILNMRLPFEREVSDMSGAFDPDTVEISLPDGLAQQIETLAQRAGVSLSSWLLASWAVLLWRLTDEARLVIGVGCSGRPYEELTNALGPYIRFVPVSAHFEEDRSFELVLASVHTSLQEAVKQQMSFTWEGGDDLVSKSATIPFFPLSFEYDAWPAVFDTSEVAFAFHKQWSCNEPFALKLRALQVGKGLQLELHHDLQRVPKPQAEHLANLFHTLLLSVTEQPQTPVGSLLLLKADEQNRLLTAFHAPTSPLSVQVLHQLFEAQVKRVPDQLAVIGRDEELTYQQLNNRANRLARVLRRRGVGPNMLVGLCLKRSAQMLVGLLGILKAGGGYVPLEAESPPARLAYQLQANQTVLLLTQQEIAPRLSDWLGVTLCLEDMEQEMAEALTLDLPSQSRGEDVASVISTSGSTGVPKGVMIRQASLVNYALALCELLEAEAGWSYATVSTLAADLGNTAIFCALVSGGCIHVLDYETFTSAEAMTRWVRKYPLDVLKIVPSHLSALLTGGEAKELRPRRALILGGEVLPPSLLEQLRELQATSDSRCQVFNHYGPTETTVGVLVNPLGVLDAADEQRREWEQVPLGRPINNTQVYVLDRRMQLVPAGVTGELFVGGAGISLGYVKLPDQTAERFVPHPWSTQPGERLYRTGDLVRSGEQGSLEFVGRRDRQVKLRGYRIELAEIEAVLCQHPQIRESVVVLREDVASNGPQLVSYVVTRQNTPIPTAQVHEFLRRSLPEYMVPVMCVRLDAWPLTANGKVDRQKLPMPERSEPEREQREAGLPRSPLEELLGEMWKDLLGLPRLSVHDHFFQVGGHSLLATQVIARVQAVLQVTIPVRELFDAPTVAGFAQRVEQVLRKNESRELPPLVAAPRPAEVPLSFAQQRLWFLDQLEPGSTAYLAARALQIEGDLNTKALEKSVQELVRRHESLRTTFEERAGQPVQVIHPVGRVVLPVIDVQTLEPVRREREARWQAQLETQRPCNLEKGPLLRTYLVRKGDRKHVLLWTMHHILTDGWSNEVLAQELSVLYEAFAKGSSSPLSALPIQYADYALWQRQWFQTGEVLGTELSYWRKQLADVSPLALPTDSARQAVQTYRGTFQTRQLLQSLSEELVALSRQENVTLFMLTLAAFQILLLRYTGQTDISVGIPIANRTRAELEEVVGFFVNTLVMRTDLGGNPTFREVLTRVREVALGAYSHQDLPFEYLVEQLQPERHPSHAPLCQVTFQLAYAMVSQPWRELRLEAPAPDGASADFDLSIRMIETEQGFLCQAVYNANLFQESTIARLLGHFQTLLEGIVNNPQAHVSDLPLLTETELNQLLVEWNATQCDYPQDLCLHQLVEQQVRRTPDAVAVLFEDQQVTYQQLDQGAKQLASSLQALGIGPEHPVGLCLERSPEMVVGLFGVLKAGGICVPLDPEDPQERLTLLLKEAHVSVLLTQERIVSRLSGHNGPVVCLDRARVERTEAPTLNRHWAILPENAAYLIWTSGSTGTPKGVLLTHRSLCNRIHWGHMAHPLGEGDRVLQEASYSVDFAIWECFAPLSGGSQVILARPGGQRDIEYQIELIERHHITVIHLIPSLLRMFLEQPDLEKCQCVRQVYGGAEPLPLELWQRFSQRMEAPFHNVYGPTEASIDSTCWTPPKGSREPRVCIGRPIGNVQVYLLDRSGVPVPIGVPGEIFLGGVGLARGYLGRPELTAERFVPHPWSRTPGARLYHSGDLARYRETGTLEHMGRADSQVKIRGVRIELGEVEARLRQHPAVREGVVVVRQDRAGDVRLVAYIVLDLLAASVLSQETQTHLTAEQLALWQHLRDETYRQETQEGDPIRREVERLLVQQIQQDLRKKLPNSMVPAHVVMLSALPLLPNGKVNRRALPAPLEVQNEVSGKQEQAQTPMEELLLGLWSEVLGQTQLATSSNFFEVGGHSLLATQLIARMRAMLGVEVPVRVIFEAPTVAGLAQRVEQMLRRGVGMQGPPLVAVPRPKQIPLSFAQQRLWYLDQFKKDGRAYLMSGAYRLLGVFDVGCFEQSLAELTRRHESLRTTFAVHADQPVQVIHCVVTDKGCRDGWGQAAVPAVVDLRELGEDERNRVVQQLSRQEACQPMDLTSGPLLRTCLLRLSSREHVLLLTLHHIITDGWSTEIFVRELITLYRAFATGQPSPLEPLPLQYADYAIFQRQWLQGKVLDTLLDYWTKQLAGARPLELPTDRPRTIAETGQAQGTPQRGQDLSVPTVSTVNQGALYRFKLSSSLSHSLMALSRQEGVTLFMTLLTAFQIVLSRYTGKADVLVGTDVANRTWSGTEELVGFFVNQLALRTNLSGNPTFRGVLKQVKQTTLEAYTHQDLPFEKLVEALNPERDASHAPLFQVKLNFQRSVPQARGPFHISSLEGDIVSLKLDAELFLTEEEANISGRFIYNALLFDASTIKRWSDHFEVLLENVVKNPDLRIRTIELLTQEEKEHKRMDKRQRLASSLSTLKQIKPKPVR